MAFRQSIGSFSDRSVNKRLESVNSFLKEKEKHFFPTKKEKNQTTA